MAGSRLMVGRRRRWSALMLVSALAGASAVAAPVVYSELDGGDLPSSGPGLTVFALDLGVNTVSGRLDIGDGGNDGDAFGLFIPLGTTLVAAQLQMTQPSGSDVRMRWGLFGGGSALGLPLETLVLNTSGTQAFTTSFASGGTYSLATTQLEGTFPNLADYQFSFTLREAGAQAPEPGSLALVGLAMLAAGWAARRRA